jgi:hypothetical protein
VSVCVSVSECECVSVCECVIVDIHDRDRDACKAAICVNQLNKTSGYKKGRGISGNTKRSFQY